MDKGDEPGTEYKAAQRERKRERNTYREGGGERERERVVKRAREKEKGSEPGRLRPQRRASAPREGARSARGRDRPVQPAVGVYLGSRICWPRALSRCKIDEFVPGIHLVNLGIVRQRM